MSLFTTAEGGWFGDAARRHGNDPETVQKEEYR